MLYKGIGPKIHESVFRAPGSHVIGDVEIAEKVSLWFNCVIRGDVHFIRIGKESNIQDGVIVHGTFEKYPTVIGNGVSIGHGAIIHGCTIEDVCLIGMGSILMDGVVIGTETIVGAGTLISPGTKIPPRSLVLGRPGRVIRPLEEDEIKSIYAVKDRYLKYVTGYDLQAE